MSGTRVGVVAILVAVGCVGACGQKPSTTTAATQASLPTSGQKVANYTVTLTPTPDPPTPGDLLLEAQVLGEDGAPVDDASLSALLSMPPMPSMGMPEMHDTVKLEPVGAGRYRGKGNLVMSGTWNVALEVRRGEAVLGTAKFALQAK